VGEGEKQKRQWRFCRPNAERRQPRGREADPHREKPRGEIRQPQWADEIMKDYL
jgi:hypothetical protein